MFCIHFMAERVLGSVYEYLSGTRMLKKVFLNIVSYFFIYVKFDIYNFLLHIKIFLYGVKNQISLGKKENHIESRYKF